MSLDDKTKLAILENNLKIREESNNLYAKKLVEKIVLGFVGFLAMAVMYGVGNLITSIVQDTLEEGREVEEVQGTEVVTEVIDG